MVDAPPVSFTRSGSVDLAYQVVGEGERDIVLMIGWVSHLEVMWELPEARHFIERFAGMGRVVLFDKRGTGLSDRPAAPATSDELVLDILAVMEAAAVENAVLDGWVDAAVAAIEFAAQHPERVSALVLGETLATSRPSDDHPWAPNEGIVGAVADALENGAWGRAVLLSTIAPTAAEDPRIRNWFERLERMSATPSMAANLLRRTVDTDVRHLLPRVQAPALVLHRREARFVPAQGVRWLAEQLPRGQYVEVSGSEVPGYLGDVDLLMDEVEDFLIGTRTGSSATKRVVTVVFSDIVGSTERVAVLGDTRWRHVLDDHHREVRRLTTRYGGRAVDTAGDGFLLAFDTPSSAVRCALDLVRETRRSGLALRVGVHTGEVVVEEDDLRGLAVHLGARVAARAEPGEVWVSQTVRDVLIGAGFAYEPRGRHVLKGVPGEWELFRVSE